MINTFAVYLSIINIINNTDLFCIYFKLTLCIHLLLTEFYLFLFIYFKENVTDFTEK